jgi:hypothetical protein
MIHSLRFLSPYLVYLLTWLFVAAKLVIITLLCGVDINLVVCTWVAIMKKSHTGRVTGRVCEKFAQNVAQSIFVKTNT